MTRSFYAFTAGPTFESSQFKTSDEALTGFGDLINLYSRSRRFEMRSAEAMPPLGGSL